MGRDGVGRNGDRDFHGEKRSNETHASTSDPEARLYRKGNGQPATLAFMGHALMENRNALVVDVRLTAAIGLAEREAAVCMVEAIDGRTTHHPGYAVSLRIRKRIAELFGWIKGAGLRKARHRGTARVGWMFTLTATAYNLTRLPKLLAAA